MRPLNCRYPSLKLFAYSGKENGLMIVGSREELQDLASKLQAATAQEVGASVKEWPHEIVFYDPQIGPYKDQHDWRLSFHIEGTVPAEQIVPLQRSANMPSVIVASTLVLAFVGLVAIVRGVWNVF